MTLSLFVCLKSYVVQALAFLVIQLLKKETGGIEQFFFNRDILKYDVYTHVCKIN